VVGHSAVHVELVTGGLDGAVTITSSFSLVAFGLEGGVWYSRLLSELFKFSVVLAPVTLIKGTVLCPVRKKRVIKCLSYPPIFKLSCVIKSELTQPSPLPPGRSSLLCVIYALCVSNELCVSNAVSLVSIYDTHTPGSVE
jgi:hypothetical protein